MDERAAIMFVDDELANLESLTDSLEDFVTPGKKQQIMEEVTAYTRARVEELLHQLEKDLK